MTASASSSGLQPDCLQEAEQGKFRNVLLRKIKVLCLSRHRAFLPIDLAWLEISGYFFRYCNKEVPNFQWIAKNLLLLFPLSLSVSHSFSINIEAK